MTTVRTTVNKIFGREPALIIAFVGAVLAYLATFEWNWLNAGQATAITAAFSGVIIALLTRPMAPALFVAALSAVAAVFAEYGLHWSDAAVTGLGAIILTGFALFGIRPQVEPVEDAR